MENANNNTNNANNTNTINKPISLILEDAKQAIVSAINQINLHPTLLEMILRDIYNEVNELAKSQYEREKIEYEQALATQKTLAEQNNNTTQESTEE